MRKLIVSLVTVAALAAGLVAGAAPADARVMSKQSVTHAMSEQSVINICIILDPDGGGLWAMTAWNHVHYGTADVVRCLYTLVGPGYYLKHCRQYVFGVGVPEPYWEPYNPVRSTWPYCW